MTTYYVRKTGNDTTGDGSSANPWLTLSKALASAAASDTIKIGDGTYEESTSGLGYWNINKSLASPLTFEAENGAAGAVSVQGASHASYNTLIRSGKLTFNFIHFKQRIPSNLAACYIYTAISDSNLTFNNCTFTITADNATITQAFYCNLADGAALDGLSFTNCTFEVAGTLTSGSHDGCRLGYSGTTGALSNVTLANCTASGRYALWINGGTTITVTGGAYTGLTSCAIILGVDSHSGGKTSNAVTLAYLTAAVSGSAGHAILVGNGCTNTTVTYCTVKACYDYALVLKEHSGTRVTYCNLSAGVASTRAAIYLKAALSAVIEHNRFFAAGSGGNAYALRLGAGDTGNKCQDGTIRYNRLIAVGPAVCLGWAGAAGDNGGTTSDYNRYRGDLGTAYGTAVTTLASLQAAWASYTGHTDNDSHSRLIVTRAYRIYRDPRLKYPIR